MGGASASPSRCWCLRSFEFCWKTYSREVAGELRGRFASPPEGISLDGYEESEEVHEDEQGTTAGYAPVHPYKAVGSGVAHGAPGAVITWAADLRTQDFIEVRDIRLEYAD